MAHRWIALTIVLLVACLGACASNGSRTSVPTDTELREQLADHHARAEARRLIARGWESWNWQTHNARWEGDILVLHEGLNPPLRVNVPEADSVRVRKFGENWYHEVRIHNIRPEPLTVWLRADTADEAKAIVNALLLLGAKAG